jgi:hypothetical protein
MKQKKECNNVIKFVINNLMVIFDQDEEPAEISGDSMNGFEDDSESPIKPAVIAFSIFCFHFGVSSVNSVLMP